MRLLILALAVISYVIYPNDSVKLKGKIQNPISDSISISYNGNKIAYYPKQHSAHVDKNGNFSLTIPLRGDAYTIAEIKHGNKLAEVLLQGGDSLVMTVNATNFD